MHQIHLAVGRLRAARQQDIVWGNAREGRVRRPLLPAATLAAAAAALPAPNRCPRCPPPSGGWSGFGALTLNQRVQGSSPCAPPLQRNWASTGRPNRLLSLASCRHFGANWRPACSTPDERFLCPMST